LRKERRLRKEGRKEGWGRLGKVKEGRKEGRKVEKEGRLRKDGRSKK
jgi:hypothetical protein